MISGTVMVTCRGDINEDNVKPCIFRPPPSNRRQTRVQPPEVRVPRYKASQLSSRTPCPLIPDPERPSRYSILKSKKETPVGSLRTKRENISHSSVSDEAGGKAKLTNRPGRE